MSGLPDVIVAGSMPVAILVAAAAGLVSFASPCVLPLVPGYLGYVTGLTGVDPGQRRGRGEEHHEDSGETQDEEPGAGRQPASALATQVNPGQAGDVTEIAGYQRQDAR
jgi:hypothetical protein